MLTWFHAWGLVACVGVVLAQQRIDQESMLFPRPSRVRDHHPKQEEPSCDELKAMWKLSKRQARAPELLNEIGSYRDPLMYNEWPAFSPLPRPMPRYRYQNNNRETFGRVVTKAPPNTVPAGDFPEMYGMLQAPLAAGKILRYSGRSRPTGYMIPPQRNKFEVLKKLIREENARDRIFKDLSSGRSALDEYQTMMGYGNAEHREENLGEDEPVARNLKKPPGNNHQVNQFSRYSDAYQPRSRRGAYQPLFDYAPMDLIPYY